MELTFNKQLAAVQEAGEDNEWYPTTNEILSQLVKCLKEDKEEFYHNFNSFLDIGAGNGKVLDYVSERIKFHNTYFVEKSRTLANFINPKHLMLGCDFWQQSFFQCAISCIYCNCPYSEYESWMVKILKEFQNFKSIYFVVPQRWENNREIQDVIKDRKLNYEVKGEFDFLNSEDRAARAKVHLIRFTSQWEYNDPNDPFTSFFESAFKYPEPKEKLVFEERIKNAQLVTGQNLIEVLVNFYEERMAELLANYTAICTLDYEILKEFEISKQSLIESLNNKLAATKKLYWNRLFDGMKNINKLLTTDSRKEILGMMNGRTGIDFNADNCYMLVDWVIRNANLYFDKQLIATYKKLMEFANVENYKSNQRVFSERQFNYNFCYRQEESEISHVKLKVGHRIVLDRCGGLTKGSYGCSLDRGLTERAANFIGDIMVIAHNLGFFPVEDRPRERDWDSSEAQIFHYKDVDGQNKLLFKVRCFYNGNVHFQFNPDFIHALNIAAGKLLKWIGSKNEASEEFGVDIEVASRLYDAANFKIGEGQLLLN